MQKLSNIFQRSVPFFKFDTYLQRVGVILYFHTYNNVNRQYPRRNLQVNVLPIFQNKLPVMSNKHGDLPQILSHGITSVSLKENLLKPVRQRRQDPIKVAQRVFEEIRNRHQGQGQMSGHGHTFNKVNVNKLFEVSDSSSNENKNLIITSTQIVELESLSSASLLKVLQDAHLSSKHKIHGYTKTIAVIRNILTKRIETNGLAFSLDVADILFMMEINCRRFVSALFDCVTVHFDSLEMTPDLLTRLMFYVFLHGSAPPRLYPKVEQFLNDHIHDFHIGDISVICLGFFRSMRRIESNLLLEKIAQKLLTDIEYVGQHGIVNILKSFRHSGYNDATFFENLAGCLINKRILENCSNLNLLMHITSSYAGLSIFHHDLLDITLKHFVNIVCKPGKSSMNQIRSKDLAKFVWAYGVFVFEPKKYRNLYLRLVSVYRERVSTEDLVYPESLADMLQGLMYLQIFPEDLIAKMFNKPTAVALRDDEVMRKAIQLLMIHNAVLIECPQYSGPRLDKSFVDSLSKVDEVKKSVDFELTVRQGLAKVRNTLNEMFGENCVHCHFILSHFRSADIELRFNRNKEAVEFEPREFNTRWRLKDKTHTRVVVQVAGLNQFCTKSSRMKGNYDTKLRQLRVLGYQVVLISHHELGEFKKMTREERHQYLTQCLNDIWTRH